MLTALVTIALLAGALLLNRYLEQLRANPKQLPYPPGPKPLPIIGNTLDLPSSYYWMVYADWAKKYGDIVHVQAFGNHFVILNSAEAVDDLLEKKSAIYSDRPRLPMMVELIGWDWLLTFVPYGEKWRRQHRIFHQYFHVEAVAAYRPVHLLEARRLLLRLLEAPGRFNRHIQQVFTATIMKVVYGIELKGADHRYVKVAEDAMHAIAVAGVPGAFLVDVLPALKYVPEWLPGASFKKTARYFRELLPPIVDEPFETVKNQYKAGVAKPSVVLDALENRVGEDINEDYELELKGIAATSFAGGSDTTRSTIQTLFLALMLHPDIQRTAQEQLDKVIGHDRLPDFDDLDHCPLIRAIVMETMRWQPVLPLAAAHSVSTDDEYRGYYIPKGALVIGNSWVILHNETTYPKPHEFHPERFLHADGSYNFLMQSPNNAAFGFGRRKCPGRHFAIDGALMTAASILACFDISRSSEDETQFVIDDPTKPIMSSGLTSYPFPFKCSIRPRSGTTASLIKQTVQRMEEME